MFKFKMMFLCLFMAPWTLAQDAKSAPKPSFPETRLFGIILLQGTNQDQVNSEALPKKTMAVLDEVRDFLPYKNFKLLDSSFIRSDRDANFRLIGPDNRTVMARMGFVPHPEREGVLQVTYFEIYEIVTNNKSQDQKEVRYKKGHIETSFSIKVGETIVVGTSRVNSKSDAAIVLFSVR